MVRPGTPGRNDFISDLHRKRNIYQVVAVNVTDFPPAQAILGAAEPVRLSSHTGPGKNGLMNLLMCAGD